MNPKFLLFLSLFTAVTLTASLAVGAPRGGGGGHFSSMRGGHTFTRGGTGTWGGRNWSGTSGTYRNWSGGNWSGDWRHHHHRFSNDVIFIGDFGFPLWWGWGYPYGYYGYGYYPYDYYGYGYGYDGYGDDGYGYDYGRPSYGYGY